jgi:CheY-like chemotaxis protein
MKTDDKTNSRILVIDDDVELTTTVKTVLESRGYIVNTANDRASGMEKAKTENPDLILLDVMMETHQDGFEMARELKKDPQSKDTPILMLTAIKEESGVDFKSVAGDPSWLPVDGFLDKPVTPKVLIDEIEKLLEK